MNLWNDKPYHSLDFELKKRFHEKVYRLALNGGMTCPNRDGHIASHGGCIFCSEGGSGDFASAPASLSISRADSGPVKERLLANKRPVTYSILHIFRPLPIPMGLWIIYVLFLQKPLPAS